MLWCCYFKKTLSKNFVMEDDWLILSRTVLIEKKPFLVKINSVESDGISWWYLSDYAFIQKYIVKQASTKDLVGLYFTNTHKAPDSFYTVIQGEFEGRAILKKHCKIL